MTLFAQRWVAACLAILIELGATRVAFAAEGVPIKPPVNAPAPKWESLDPQPSDARTSDVPSGRSKLPVKEKIRQQAKAAELTPIVPSPNDLTKPAYQLYAQIDIPILGVGAVLAAARFVRTQPAFCAPLCDKSTLNGIDHLTAGIYDKNWSLASDIGLYTVIGGSALLLVLDEGFWPGLNDIVVVAESGLLATAMSALAELAQGRPRPYEYGTVAPLAQRNSADAGLSFISGHATVTFAIAVSTYMTMRRLHPEKGTWIPLVTVLLGVGTAAFVATARVAAGQHFITDSIAGAVVGSAMGILIPSLHGSPVRILPTVSSQSVSLQLVGLW